MGNKSNKKTDEPEYFSLQVSQARRFYFELKPPRTKPLSIISAGCEHCSPDYQIQRKGFPYYGLEFVAHGKGTLQLKRNSFALHPGQIFTYGPRVPQEIMTNPDDLLVKYFVDFIGSKANKILDKYNLSPGIVVQVTNPNDILAIFDDLIDNGLNGTKFSPKICEVILQHLILKIKESMIPDGDIITSAFSTYQQCREYMRINYMSLKNLDQIAQRSYIDKAYLCRLFQRFDHQSPYQYLMRLKMNEAAHRLKESGILVKEVAYEFGFNDPFHFSRSFKNVFGLSPESFRHLR